MWAWLVEIEAPMEALRVVALTRTRVENFMALRSIDGAVAVFAMRSN
jgi:hypothetical protein